MGRNVSARNVFRYLHSIFMFAAFLLIFVLAPLVLFFGHQFFIVRVALSFVLGFSAYRIFSFYCNFRVSSSLVGLGPVYSLMFGSLLVLVFQSLSRYRLVSISFISFALLCLIAFVQFVGCFILTLYLFNCYFSVPLYFTSVHLLPFTSCRSSRIKFVC